MGGVCCRAPAPAVGWGDRSCTLCLSCCRLQDGKCKALVLITPKCGLHAPSKHAVWKDAKRACHAQVTVWWPPAHLTARSGGAAVRQQAAAAAAAPADAPAAQGFSAETARILQSLAPAPTAAAAAAKEDAESEAAEEVAAEQLRHPAPVLSLQWSPGGLQGGTLA